MLRRLKYWIPTICVAILISVFSTQYFSGFVPLREPSVRDVMIDASGAVLAQVLVWVYAKIRQNLARQQPLATHSVVHSPLFPPIQLVVEILCAFLVPAVRGLLFEMPARNLRRTRGQVTPQGLQPL